MHRLIHEMQQTGLLTGLQAFHTTLHLGEGMDIWRPLRSLANEETQLVVVVEITNEHAHEHVLAGNIESFRTVWFGDLLIEHLTQFWRHQLIGINHQDPLVCSRLDGKRPGRFRTFVVGFGKGHHLAAILLCDRHRIVGTLHIAHHHLVEVLDRLQHLGQMLSGIIGVDDD